MEILYLHMIGESNRNIAAQLGISESTVSGKLNSDWFRNQKAEIHARTVTSFSNGTYSPLAVARSFSLEALNTVVDLMRGARSERIRQLSAFDILDRAGAKAPTRVETTDMNKLFDQMTAEELEAYAIDRKIPDRLTRGLENLQSPGGGSDKDSTVH
jgi:hypothetical protein